MRNTIGDWKMIRATIGIFFLTLITATAQVAIGISLPRNEYLRYESIDIDVKITNQTAEPMKLEGNVGDKPWLSFYVTNKDEFEIKRTQKKWIPPSVSLNPGEIKTISVNIQPFFVLGDPGIYNVSADLNFPDKTTSTRGLDFTVVQGVSVWKQTFYPKFEGKSEQRVYSIHAHRLKEQNSLYARIESIDLQQIFTTVNLGPAVSYSDPQCKIDANGDFFVLHQSGTRNYTYHHFSGEGKRLQVRYFSNISSTPKLIKNDKNETLVVGGEEIFENDTKTEFFLPPGSNFPYSTN
jgi:hypothetical protein